MRKRSMDGCGCCLGTRPNSVTKGFVARRFKLQSQLQHGGSTAAFPFLRDWLGIMCNSLLPLLQSVESEILGEIRKGALS